MATILEEYVESSAELPRRLQAAFQTIRELDEQDTALHAAVHAALSRRMESAVAAAAAPPPTVAARKARTDALAAEAALIDADAAAACEHANVKCTLAKECYDLVDSHIRRLDKDLATFDREAARLGGGGADSPERAAALHAAALHAAGAAGAPKPKSSAKRSHKAGGSAAAAAALPPGALAAAGGPFGVLAGGLLARSDLAVDPNEPLYCSCQRVSFGDMVACESDTCPIEWFHYECVGLPAGQEPKGKWFCPGCAAQRKKSKPSGR